jgi:uncharacterized protein YndB with AHSA1/START domain
MTVTAVRKDPDNLTMTLTAEFPVSPERVWQLWADPRLLERWWGPPTYPATFDSHDFRTGGRVKYHMTGPEGDQPRGWWRMISVDEPKRIELEDGFADADGNPIEGGPTTIMVATIEEASEGGTDMVITSTFPSIENMQEMLNMGMEEGLAEALGQIDALLAA